MHETHNIFGWRESGAVSESEALAAVPGSAQIRPTESHYVQQASVARVELGLRPNFHNQLIACESDRARRTSHVLVHVHVRVTS